MFSSSLSTHSPQASFLGYGLSIPFLTSSDRLAAYFTKRNNMIREAEMRLGVLLPAMIIAPCGIILYGLAAEHNLHWVAYFFGVGMDQWGSLFYFSFTLAYAVDSYQSNTSESLWIDYFCNSKIIWPYRVREALHSDMVPTLFNLSDILSSNTS